MTHPGADQIVAAIIDYEHALAVPHGSAFDPIWRQRLRVDDDSVTMLLDPNLNPDLYDRSRHITHLVHMHEAAERATYHYPFKPCEGSSCVDLSQDGDVKVVFVNDVTPDGAHVYVLSDTPQQDTENVIPTVWPHEVLIGRDGRPIVRLSDIFNHALLLRSDGGTTYVEGSEGGPSLERSPAQEFVQRLVFGTLTSDTCDLRLAENCGGPTLLVVESKGCLVQLWEACEDCYNTARDTARAALQAAEQAALDAVQRQGGESE